MNINKDELFWFKKGFFPQTHETKQDFLIRVQKNQSTLARQQITTPAALEQCMLDPTWVEVRYAKLAPWVLGYTTFTDYKLPVVTLSSFYKKRRQVTLSHELIHVCRQEFVDSPYEEIIAHFFDQSAAWRAKWGGVLAKAWLNLCLVLAIFLQLVACLCAFFVESELLPIGIFFFQIVAYLCVLAMLATARKLWKTFYRAYQTIEKALGTTKAKTLLVRLSPSELERYGKLSPCELVREFKNPGSYREELLAKLVL